MNYYNFYLIYSFVEILFEKCLAHIYSHATMSRAREYIMLYFKINSFYNISTYNINNKHNTI